uniref:Uncharacterized protein n=1 Tax=Timema genevievae TaxID=629358 RepID=A0A7R9JYP7_TIMGE|nr:unnamed protein product [Timema genevievae]
MQSVCYLLGILVTLSGVVASLEDKSSENGVPETRVGHRLKMIFPLLLRISARLAAIVPLTSIAILLLVAFVIFAKKAFIVSLISLWLVLADKLKQSHKDSQTNHVRVRKPSNKVYEYESPAEFYFRNGEDFSKFNWDYSNTDTHFGGRLV